MNRNTRILTVLGWITALGYVAVAIFEIFIDADEELSTRIGFPVFLVVLATALMAGIGLISSRPTLGAIVASSSALVGAFVLFWTFLAILLGATIVVFSVLVVRNAAPVDEVPA